ncbi:MAG: hypothetical protein ABR986_11765 [Methanomassiliicoccales archaeon]|jgi:hypothetical protein
MAGTYVVMVTLDGRNQFDRILEGEGAAKAAAKRYAKDILTLQEKGDKGSWEVLTMKVIDRLAFAYGGPDMMLNAPKGERIGPDGTSCEQSWRKLLYARRNGLDKGSIVNAEICSGL